MQMSGQIVEAFTNLLSTKLRTLLAILGVLVGTASVVAMVSGGELATREALAQFKTLGTNLLAVQINTAPGGNNNDKLSLETVEGLSTVSKDIHLIAPYTSLYLPLVYAGKNIDGSVLGVTNTVAKVMKLKVQQGRFISFLDNYEPFCVVGNGIYQAMQQQTLQNPIGQQINLGSNIFTIVGVLTPADNNAFMYADINNAVMIPIQDSLMLSKYADINNIVLSLNPAADPDELQTKITAYFSQVSPSKQLYFQSAKQIVASMRKQQAILTLFLGFIGSIALLVGGIGVMNVMLVSVTERKREIGIRLAIGAKRKDIQLMFLIESVVLTFFGGLLGVIIGILISFIIAIVKGWGFSLFLWPPLIGFTVSVLTGIFFGYYPAYKAAKLDPIETLRSE